MSRKERELNEIFRKNSITSYGILIAKNIVATYECLGNNHSKQLREIYNEAKNSYNLNEEETLYIETLIDRYLKEKYNLQLVSKDKMSKIEIKELN